jgi:hypothetical protein
LKKEQRERGGRREEREEKRRAKSTSSPLYKVRVLETDPSKIALAIYKSTVISIRSLFFLSTTNKKY